MAVLFGRCRSCAQEEVEITCDLFAFLTTEPNDVVKSVHPEAVLTTGEGLKVWMRARQICSPDERLVPLRC